MVTYKQESSFRDEIASEIPRSILETAIEWIKKNMEPDDVFDKRELEDWARSNGFTEGEPS
jgi:hypothetical protein